MIVSIFSRSHISRVSMQSIDQFDKLEAACRTPEEYPANLLRTQSFQHSLQSYKKSLQDKRVKLFHPRTHIVDILEAYDGEKGVFGLEIFEHC